MNQLNKNQYAPVVLFVYNRLEHVKETLNSLLENELSIESELFIYSDGPKNDIDLLKVKSVRKYLETISGFKTIQIIEKKINNGLANSVITGVSEVLQKYPKVIVVEDDLQVSPDFLSFMNSALDFYADSPEIFSISGYNFPIKIPANYKNDVYLSYRASSWGWATWCDRWDKADWEVKDYQEFKKDRTAQHLFNRGGEDLTPMLHKQMKGIIDSWAIRWAYSHYKNNSYCLYPNRSFVNNIGMDNSGKHAKKSERYISNLAVSFDNKIFKIHLKINDDIMIQLRMFFQQSFYRKILNFIMGY
ncbi:MAG: glycosyltransferase [Bacteroidales bacterium]|nr:glycosyltransferase [Bacteroidales bacterium]